MSDNDLNRPMDDQQEPAFSAGLNEGQPVPSNNQGRRHKRNVMAARVPSDVKVSDLLVHLRPVAFNWTLMNQQIPVDLRLIQTEL